MKTASHPAWARPLAAAGLFLCGGGLSAQELSSVAISTWPSTTHYLGFPEFVDAQDGQIRITAGGPYTLYLNGDLVGSDADPSTVEIWQDLAFKKKENQVAVVVDHDGTRSPYGLYLVVDGAEEQFVSSPTDRSMPWFWSGDPLPNDEGGWTQLKLSKLDEHEEDGRLITWQAAQQGTLEPRDFVEFEDLDLTRAGSVAGFPGGLSGQEQGLQLRSLAGQNMALNSRTSDPNLVDGDITKGVAFRKGAASLGQGVRTDLGRLLLLERVRVLTEPPGRNNTYEDLSLRGYSILISRDGIGYREVGARNQITTYHESEVAFPPTPARHVSLTITEFSSRDANPKVGELEVFVQGRDDRGAYLSPPLDLNTSETKNFERAIRFGEVPTNTEMELRFRSGQDGESWSEWSPWSARSEIPLTVPEPRGYLQFEARMLSRILDATPRLDSLVIWFEEDAFPASRASGSISPARASIGVDTLFTYTLQLEMEESNAGVERLAILTPWPARLDAGAVQGLGEAAIASSYTTVDSLVLIFDPPITSATGTTEVVIPFTTRLLSASHEFQGLLFAPGQAASLQVDRREGTDPVTELPYTTVAEAADFGIPILDDVQAHPAVFTPNGDDTNDFAVLGFTLGRVSGSFVHVEIYDVGGKLVRSLPSSRLNPGSYSPVGTGEEALPGRWDGLDDEGGLVPPGLYLYRIVVDLEPDDEVATGVVGLAY